MKRLIVIILLALSITGYSQKNAVVYTSGGTNISDANAAVGDVLSGKTFYSGSTPIKTGTMSDNGTVSTDITTVAQEVTIAAGKHSGSGVVKISTTEQAKIIASNIKDGVTILGVTGNVTSSGGTYTKTVRILTSSGTWTKPTGLVFLEVICIGGGGGGASGSKQASGVVSRAGSGGTAACMAWSTLLAGELSGTESYTIGAGGAGGASVTANSTNGTTGSAGGDTYFSGTNFATSKVYAKGGTGGMYNNPGSQSSITAQKPATTFIGGSGGASSSTGVAGSTAAAQNNSISYQNYFGGGGGGGINTSNAQSAGGSGAVYYNKSGTLSSANGGGVTANGGDGQNYYMNRMPFVMGTAGTQYADVTIGYGTPGGGGGSSTSGNAGRGGDGGLYGGAGGGGGAARNDVGNSGRGGNGAQGVIILIEHIVL